MGDGLAVTDQLPTNERPVSAPTTGSVIEQLKAPSLFKHGEHLGLLMRDHFNLPAHFGSFFSWNTGFPSLGGVQPYLRQVDWTSAPEVHLKSGCPTGMIGIVFFT